MIASLKKIFNRGIRRDRFKVIRRADGVFLVNYTNYIDRKLIIDGGYEREQLDMFCKLANSLGAEEFFDIGANIGLYTVKVASVPSISAVHSFEPVSVNRNQLHANILLNGVDDIVNVHACALSNVCGEVTFLKNLGNSTGRSRIKATNSNELDDTKFVEVQVKTQRLDDLFFLRNKKLAVKIDVEGHEVMVIQGMTNLLKNNICILQVESYPHTADETGELLRQCDYALVATIGNDHYYANAPV